MIDLEKLDTYLYQGQSFKGIDILNWCKNNFNSNDFNYKYAANEIYDNYFNDDTSLNLKNFYYILYGDCLLRNDIYFIRRDLIMSPKNNKTIIRYKEMKKLLDKLYSIIKEIISISTYTQRDINDMYENLALMSSRLSRIGISNSDEKIILEAFSNSANYKRYQIYTIINSTIADLNTILHVLKTIKK